MKLYRTTIGPMVEINGSWHVVPDLSWDSIFKLPDPRQVIEQDIHSHGDLHRRPPPAEADVLAPIGSQEVWAAGVTYLRSRDARKEEAKDAGGGDFYDKVYAADRPELFFKSTAPSQPSARARPFGCARTRPGTFPNPNSHSR